MSRRYQAKKRNIMALAAIISAALLLGLLLIVALLNLPKNGIMPPEEPRSAVLIKTPYATLKYPLKWEKYLAHEGKFEDGGYIETFYCCMNGEKIEMFQVYLGKQDWGTFIAYVTTDDGPVAFCVESADIPKMEGWPEEDRLTLSAMTDDINVVIDCFLADYAAES